jgi:hypothetical protein
MAELSDAHVAGHTVSVRVEDHTFAATIDGQRLEGQVGTPLRVDW